MSFLLLYTLVSFVSLSLSSSFFSFYLPLAVSIATLAGLSLYLIWKYRDRERNRVRNMSRDGHENRNRNRNRDSVSTPRHSYTSNHSEASAEIYRGSYPYQEFPERERERGREERGEREREREGERWRKELKSACVGSIRSLLTFFVFEITYPCVFHIEEFLADTSLFKFCKGGIKIYLFYFSYLMKRTGNFVKDTEQEKKKKEEKQNKHKNEKDDMARDKQKQKQKQKEKEKEKEKDKDKDKDKDKNKDKDKDKDNDKDTEKEKEYGFMNLNAAWKKSSGHDIFLSSLNKILEAMAGITANNINNSDDSSYNKQCEVGTRRVSSSPPPSSLSSSSSFFLSSFSSSSSTSSSSPSSSAASSSFSTSLLYPLSWLNTEEITRFRTFRKQLKDLEGSPEVEVGLPSFSPSPNFNRLSHNNHNNKNNDNNLQYSNNCDIYNGNSNNQKSYSHINSGAFLYKDPSPSALPGIEKDINILLASIIHWFFCYLLVLLLSSIYTDIHVKKYTFSRSVYRHYRKSLFLFQITCIILMGYTVAFVLYEHVQLFFVGFLLLVYGLSIANKGRVTNGNFLTHLISRYLWTMLSDWELNLRVGNVRIEMDLRL